MDENSEIIQVHIEDLIIHVDMDTAMKLENDLDFRSQYLAAIRSHMKKQELAAKIPQESPVKKNDMVWKSSKSQSDHDHKATYFFLSLRSKFKAEFDDKKTNKNSIWQKIAAIMNENNFYVGEGTDGREKCRQKFANLQASFIKYIDRRRQTGEGKIIKPPYFDELSEILGDKHKCEPVLIIDSLGPVSGNASETQKMYQDKDSVLSQPGTSKDDSPRVLQSSNDHAQNQFSLEQNTIRPLPQPELSKDKSLRVSQSSNDHPQKNRFSLVQNTVRPDKNKLLQQYVNISRENLEVNKTNFTEMLQYMREQSNKNQEQMMALIKALGPNKNKRKRNRESDDEGD